MPVADGAFFIRSAGPSACASYLAFDIFDLSALARWYARRHYKTHAAIEEVFYLPADAPEHEVRLIEVNGSITEPSSPLEPIDIGGAEGHTLMVLDVTPVQWKRRSDRRIQAFQFRSAPLFPLERNSRPYNSDLMELRGPPKTD
jgi:hypothetical protein